MIPRSVRILVCTEPVDMRRSFDGLARAAREVLGEDPRSGVLCVFVNRRCNRLKALWWDHNGYCLLYKRLHRAIFVRPDPTSKSRPIARIDGRELTRLLSGIPRQVRRRSTTQRA